jgi:hypothetical protein
MNEINLLGECEKVFHFWHSPLYFFQVCWLGGEREEEELQAHSIAQITHKRKFSWKVYCFESLYLWHSRMMLNSEEIRVL